MFHGSSVMGIYSEWSIMIPPRNNMNTKKYSDRAYTYFPNTFFGDPQTCLAFVLFIAHSKTKLCYVIFYLLIIHLSQVQILPSTRSSEMPTIHVYDSVLCSLYTGKCLHIEAAGSPRTHLLIHQTTQCCVPDHH